MHQGVGIGLSTADSLASALGGRISVISTAYQENMFRTEAKFKIKPTH